MPLYPSLAVQPKHPGQTIGRGYALNPASSKLNGGQKTQPGKKNVAGDCTIGRVRTPVTALQPRRLQSAGR